MSGLEYPYERSQLRTFSPLAAGYGAVKRFMGRATTLGHRSPSKPRSEDSQGSAIRATGPQWEGRYALQCLTKPPTANRPSLEAGFKTMTSSWDPESGLLSYWSENAVPDDDNLIRGFILGLEHEDGRQLDILATMFPKEMCTIRCGFVLESPLRWLSLPVGERDRVQVVGNGHTIDLHRPHPTRWCFAIENDHPVGQPAPFRAAAFSLETDFPDPPWDRLHVRFEAICEQGTTQTNLRLRRLP